MKKLKTHANGMRYRRSKVIIEKTESTIIIRCSKGQTDDFVVWLKAMAKKLNIDVLYFIKKFLALLLLI